MKKISRWDWGTSALRVRLVDAEAITVLAEVKSADGISKTFESWKNRGKSEKDRLSFYQSVLAVQIKKLGEQLRSLLNEVPVIVSGMVSSDIGMIEIPYKEIPFDLNGSGPTVERMDATANFKHSLFVISGVKTTDDVMRGEETQLIGCINKDDKEEHLFIFPGTHSKHVTVKSGAFTGFKTYMTGEFFDLLSAKSILSSSLERGEGLISETHKKSFEEGVKASGQSNLLHNSFLARTNHLFKRLTQQQNYYYLSGVIIGTEVGELRTNNNQIMLVASGELMELYMIALKTVCGDPLNLKVEDPDQALVNGQLRIIMNLHS